MPKFHKVKKGDTLYKVSRSRDFGGRLYSVVKVVEINPEHKQARVEIRKERGTGKVDHWVLGEKEIEKLSWSEPATK